MRLVKIPPPGTFCHQEAIIEMVRKSGAKTFVEIGCGDGSLSRKLCQMGLKGFGVDFSAAAVALAKQEMADYVRNGSYKLLQADIMDGSPLDEPVDLALSIMVMEHIEDERRFLRESIKMVKPGGHLIIAVPGRRDCWSFEDETVGHYRRYDRVDMQNALSECGLTEKTTWSVGVPVVNLLAGVTNVLLKRSATEVNKMSLSKVEQTTTSGIREVPFKTVFPPVFKLILNRFTLYPLFVVQRIFYQSNIGLILMTLAQVPKVSSDLERAPKLAATAGRNQ
ncbi:MAG: class I SAM-dependent methyltransferase [Candidatus Obscuribacterales bacterium]|nr:class I SAM-dependent methyltransferase [Candidatus Obscuribacterales bacterium]